MSVALERRGGDRRGFEGTGGGGAYMHRGMARIAAFDSPPAAAAEEEELGLCSSSSVSSSIGKNSDIDGDGDGGGEEEGSEVQSSFKGPLDALDSLEQVLPLRRGISRFYNGKSKSFASLADASSASSIKDMGKPENAYTRKRRNLLACSDTFLDRNRNFPLKSNGGGISKRPLHSSRSTLALAVAMSNGGRSSTLSNLNSLPLLPPAHPHTKSRLFSVNVPSPTPSPSPPQSPSPHSQQDSPPWRSFSLADLEQCVTAASAVNASPLFSVSNANIDSRNL